MPRPRFVGLGAALVAALGCGNTLIEQPTPATGGSASSANCCSAKEVCQGRSGCSGNNRCEGRDPGSCDKSAPDHAKGAPVATVSSAPVPAPKP